MQRRKFLFWVGFGLFSAGEALGLPQLDRAAAAAMRIGGSRRRRPSTGSSNNSNPVYHETQKPVVLRDDLTNEELVEQREPLVEQPETEAEKKPGEPHAKRLARHGRP